MGVGVSSWQLARAVARTGQLGVVSGVALDATLARRLQLGDPGGHLRRALAHFPGRAAAERIVARYFVPGGIGPARPSAGGRTALPGGTSDRSAGPRGTTRLKKRNNP